MDKELCRILINLMHRFDIVYFMPELHNASIWYCVSYTSVFLSMWFMIMAFLCGFYFCVFWDLQLLLVYFVMSAWKFEKWVMAIGCHCWWCDAGLSFVCPGEVNEEVNGEEYLVNGSDWSYGMNVISF